MTDGGGREGLSSRIQDAVSRLEGDFRLSIAAIVMEDNLEDIVSMIEAYSGRDVRISLIPYECYTDAEILATRQRLGRLLGRDKDAVSLFVSPGIMDLDKVKDNLESIEVKQERIRTSSSTLKGSPI